jgi:hypothetical protein
MHKETASPGGHGEQGEFIPVKWGRMAKHFLLESVHVLGHAWFLIWM